MKANDVTEKFEDLPEEDKQAFLGISRSGINFDDIVFMKNKYPETYKKWKDDYFKEQAELAAKMKAFQDEQEDRRNNPSKYRPFNTYRCFNCGEKYKSQDPNNCPKCGPLPEDE